MHFFFSWLQVVGFLVGFALQDLRITFGIMALASLTLVLVRSTYSFNISNNDHFTHTDFSFIVTVGAPSPVAHV